MPKLEDIEQFKDKINSLGNEEQILAERGESIVDIPPPEQGVPDDISALLNDISDIADSTDDGTADSDNQAESIGAEADIFDTELADTAVETDDSFDDDELGNISDFGEMFEDTEDESDFMPDDLVSPLPDDADDFDTADTASPEDNLFDSESFDPDSFDIPETPDDVLSDTDAIPETEDSGDFNLPDDFNIDDTFTDEIPPDASADNFSIQDVDSDSIEDLLTGVDDSPELDDLPDDFDTAEDIMPESGDENFDLPDDFDTAEDIMPESGDENFDLPDDFDAAEDLMPESGDENFDLPDDFDAAEDLMPESGDENFDLPDDFDAAEDLMPESGDENFDLPDDFDAAEDLMPESGDENFDLPDDFDTAEDLMPESGDENFDLPDDLDEVSGLTEQDSDDDFDIGSLDDISLEDELEINSDDGLSSGVEELEDLEELGDLEEALDMDELDSASNESDEFSLEDLGEEYSNLEEIEETSLPEEKEVSSAAPEYKVPEKTDTESDFSIEKEKLDRVTETLNQMPRNLKFIIEDLIGNKGLSGKRLNNLVEKLASGASVKEITELAEKITGRKIKIPSQYERKTWEELEEEKQTFSYIFRHQILPYTGKIALISIVLFFTVFVIKKQVFDPLYSNYMYDKGYKLLVAENYKASDRLFAKASRLKPFKKQFYRYAEGYIEKREFGRAERKYITMLGRALSSEREKSRKEQEGGYFHTDKKGFLDYASLKTFYQGEYAESDRILNDYILQKGNKWDYEALLDKIDNFLNWGEIDKEQFDSASYVLNDCLSKFGNKPKLIFRKMAYYLHSGRIDQIENKAKSDIKSGDSKSIDVRKYYSLLGEFKNYVENVKEKYTDPYMVTDFYKYMIDHDRLEGVEDPLINISNIDKKLLEPHYQLSIYWNRMEKKVLEKQALTTIESLLKSSDLGHIRDNYPHSYLHAEAQRNQMDIFTQNRLGKFSYNDDEILDAQRYYKKAVDRFEKYSPLPGDTASYGHIYEDLGDIYYYNAGKYNEALKHYANAYRTGYKSDNLDYKIGFINYKNRNYRKAAENFYDITLKARENETALLAFANASFNNGVYSPAKAYYDRVIEKIEYWRDHEKVFDLDRRKDQQEILEKLMQVYNNQGVTLFKLAEKNRNQEYYSKSLVYLSQSAELYDTLMRDPLTMNKTLTKPLAQLNMKWILLNSGWKNSTYVKSVIPYSSDNMSLDSPVIYNSIDHDLFGKISTTLK